MMKALLIISAPQHILYGLEAKHKFSAHYVDALIINREPEYLAVLQIMLSDLSFNCIDIVNMATSRRRSIPTVVELIYSLVKKVNHWQYDTLFIADYGTVIASNIPNISNVIYLGDGTKQICRENQDRRFVHRDIYVTLLNRLFILIGRNKKQPITTTTFSPFTKSISERNQFDNLRSRYSKLRKESEKTVYFFGAYFSDNEQSHIMKDCDYFFLLKKIKQHYKENYKNINFIYVPHRNENTNKISSIKGIGINVEKFTFPAEYEFIKRGFTPTHVAGFYSSCLYHFTLINNDIRVLAFKPQASLFDASYYNSVKTVYDWLSDKLEIMEIQNDYSR